MTVPNPHLRSSKVGSTPRRYCLSWRTYIGHRGGCVARLNTSRGIDDLLHLLRVERQPGQRRSRGGRPRAARIRIGAASGALTVTEILTGGGSAPSVRLDRIHHHAAAGMPQRDEPGLRDLLDEIAERADAVVALGKRRVELQQRALQQAELRRDLAIGQHLERPLHERDRLGDIRRRSRGGAAVLAARAGPGTTGLRLTRFS